MDKGGFYPYILSHLGLEVEIPRKESPRDEKRNK